MRLARSLTVGIATLAATTAVAPAFAATTKPTSLTMKTAHSSAAPKHTDSLTATLKSGSKDLANKKIYLYEKKPGAKSWGKPIAGHVTNTKGQYVFKVTITGKKGQKDEFEVKFPAGGGYGASHSKVITVSVS